MKQGDNCPLVLEHTGGRGGREDRGAGGQLDPSTQTPLPGVQ